METLFTSKLHGFANFSRSAIEPVLTEQSILSLLIVLGSSISLVGLVFAFITYSLFSDLRNLSGTTLMNLLASLFMTQLLYVIGVGGISDPELCIALAFSLQYIRLTVYCWMLVITHEMFAQFRNLRPNNLNNESNHNIGRKFLRYSAFAWGFPAILLSGSVSLQYHEKHGSITNVDSIKEQNCWFLDKNAFVYCYLIPSGLLMLISVIYLVRSAIVSRYIISMQVDRKERDKQKEKRRLQIILYMRIISVLVIVGSLSGLTKFIRWEMFWLSYHVGQGLQGIIIAILVTCNCKVLKLYTKGLKCSSNKNILSNYKNVKVEAQNILCRNKSVSKSSSLQLLTLEPDTDPV